MVSDEEVFSLIQAHILTTFPTYRASQLRYYVVVKGDDRDLEGFVLHVRDEAKPVYKGSGYQILYGHQTRARSKVVAASTGMPGVVVLLPSSSNKTFMLLSPGDQLPCKRLRSSDMVSPQQVDLAWLDICLWRWFL